MSVPTSSVESEQITRADASGLTPVVVRRHTNNAGVTEIVEIPGRGHALPVDSGWHDVADTAPNFVKRFT